MKKIFFSVMVLLLANHLFAQSIKVNETDKVTGKKMIETDYVTLLNNYPAYLYSKIKMNDTNYILELRGGDIAVAEINANDKVIIKTNDSTEITGYSSGKQNFVIDDNAKYYTHDYLIKKKDVELLSQKKIIYIRKYAGQKYDDILVPTSNQDKLQGAASLLLKTN